MHSSRTVQDTLGRHAYGPPGHILLAALSTPLQGCALHGAPAYSLFGAYFPLWLVAGIFGVFAALLANRVMAGKGLFAVVPLQLLVCASVGVVAAVLFWAVIAGEFA